MAEQVNKTFRSAVTATAFNLTLSKTMIATLASIADEYRLREGSRDPKRDRTLKGENKRHNMLITELGRNDSLTPSRALKNRGLVHSPVPEWPGIYELTEAGEHVLALLKIAGLVKEIDLAELELGTP